MSPVAGPAAGAAPTTAIAAARPRRADPDRPPADRDAPADGARVSAAGSGVDRDVGAPTATDTGLTGAPATTTQDTTAQETTAPRNASAAEHKQHGPKTPGVRPQMSSPSRRPPCKFFASSKGCRAGEACPFRHEHTRADHASPSAAPSSSPNASDARASPVAHRPARRGRGSVSSQRPDIASTAQPSAPPQRYTTPAHAPVERPTSTAEAQDPRAFQISQIQRRYGNTTTIASQDDGTTVVRFAMAPSDPDFPFDLDRLRCAVRVPAGFPARGPPTLVVENAEIERGFRLNVERGFAAVWAELRAKTLLNAVKMLDRRLEALLSAEKAEFVTIVANHDRGQKKAEATRPAVQEPAPAAQAPTPAPPKRPRTPPASFERVEQARAKRAAETKTLEHRMGRESGFAKEADGTIFTLPIEPRKRDSLPPELKAVRTLRLFVPQSYDVAHCSIELIGVEGAPCQNVEAVFERRARERRDVTLLAHINYLSQNMHVMATEKVLPEVQPEPALPTLEHHDDVESGGEGNTSATEVLDTDKSHVKVIPRPPEWSRAADGESDSEDSDYDTGDEDTAEGEDYSTSEEPDGQAPTQPRETGVMLSLPGLQLSNVELLEICLLSLTVKCTRCKETADIHGVKPSDETSTSHGRSQTCRKCSLDLSVSFRRDLMHATSARAGYLDLDNCTPQDLLSSHFLPTCAKCSTTYPRPGIAGARVASDSLAICRACHARMLFVLPQVSFLRLGPSALPTALPRRPGKRHGGTGAKDERARLGIVPGEELPRRGTCGHYRKSFRWFRFACCEALHACDRCHDAAAAHPPELANRMVCGFCSREQPFAPESCRFCRRELTGRKGRGFWEGGRGTRDPKRMSRKDPRKFKLGRKMRLDREKAREKNER